jgi:glycosyltransferase involved in cell wall biosynthesis
LIRDRKKLISIVIPAWNEEAGIRHTIDSIPKQGLDIAGYSIEVIVVDGDSSDKTREAAENLGAKVLVENKTGYGRAYKAGFAATRGDIIVTVDADGSYPLDRMTFYLKELEEKGLDFITVNRFSNLGENSMSFCHLIGNKILSLTMNILYGIDITDSQSGMWIMKREFIEEIELSSDDMSLSEEIKIIAFKHFKSLEVDGKYSERIGIAKLGTLYHGWHNFKYLFKFRPKLNSALKRKIYIEAT